MNKFGAILTIIGGVVFAYIILTAAMPAISSIVSSANASLPADTSAYPGGREILTSAPWWMYFIPGIIGIASIVIILKHKA